MLASNLFTDLYQLTMFQAAWASGADKLEASFYLHFRDMPFNGGYAIACGAASVARIIDDFNLSKTDIDYLADLPSPDAAAQQSKVSGTIQQPNISNAIQSRAGVAQASVAHAVVARAGITRQDSNPSVARSLLFDRAFLHHLAGLRLSLDIDCVAEGTAVFAYEPILRATGPLCQCMLLETALLNALNFETLIATKAARICAAAGGPVAEFGARRAQGPNGANLAARAAIVGGCSSTSNVLAGQLYDLPVSGTHSHAWVMTFDSELAAFRSFVAQFPHNSILVVDTYDTLQGVKNAIIVGKEMEERGQRLHGIRIDSGDLAWLSVQARGMLDAASLGYVKIVASNDLDEYTIQSLRTEQGAQIDLWGVGTRLVCAFGQPALGGVYKLSAIREPGQPTYRPVLKASEQTYKSTLPGQPTLRRYFDADDLMAGDMIYDLSRPPARAYITDPFDSLRQKQLAGLRYSEPLQPLVRQGQVVRCPPSAGQAQKTTTQSLSQLSPSIKRLLNPHTYPVGLEDSLLAQRDTLLQKARQHD
ncbi:MAG: nicotinate phosphoribosyltransferase [Coriobacteriales bacterium]|jgi:nicotinate phosphoribosyltransferase|nr:nicotinate phosphoribosyltransferase [Coriobacteriales bacterium]